MSRGPRSTPPELPGFTADRWLGGGGFADVFLYTQLRPSRQVAVKILRGEHLSAQALAQFDAEADIMAEVSTHPYIVTIFTSGVSPDGRPYIVMEHYPKPHFGDRAKGGTMDITEVLRTGIQVASAVETAHRAGIIHRDIKPANILTSAFDRPGLTDFGISGVQTDGELTAATGLTIAYTAPEILEERSPGSVATDVFGLGATVAALAAGRSAFWSPHGDNTDQAVLARALSGQVTPITRPDVPASLNHFLAQAMRPDPSQRPGSALAFAQSLQQIEQELRLQPTPIDVVGLGGTTRVARDEDDDERTRRPIQVVDPEGPPGRPSATTPSFGALDTPPIAPDTRTISKRPSTNPTSGSFAPPVPAPSGDLTGRRATVNDQAPSAPPTSIPHDAADETVARPRARGRFEPPVSEASDPAGSSKGFTPPLVGGVSSPAAEPASAALPAPRRPLPWKMIGAAAALIAAIIVVVIIFSQGGRNVKDAPNGRGGGLQASPQSMPPGDETSNSGAPANLPDDLALDPFVTPEVGLISTTMTWTAPSDKAVYLSVDARSSSGEAQQQVIDLSPADTATGRVGVTITAGPDGRCTKMFLGAHEVPSAVCSGGPPCISVSARKQGAASAGPVTVVIPPGRRSEAAAQAPPAGFLPEAYASVCSDTGTQG